MEYKRCSSCIPGLGALTGNIDVVHTEAANTTDMWIITHGYNVGVSKLIGEAVAAENERRQALRCHKHPNTTGATLPQLTLIGIPREDFLKHSHVLEHRVRSICTTPHDSHRVEIQNEGNLPEENKFELNPEHTHFLMLRDNTVNKTGSHYFMLRLEQFLNSSEEVMTQLQDQEAGKTELVMYMEIPVVALLVQGGYNCSRMILEHLKKQMPVVVLRGSGGLADLLAFAFHEVTQRPGGMNDLDFVENFLKPELANKIAYNFPNFRDNSLARNSFRDRVMGCVRYATQVTPSETAESWAVCATPPRDRRVMGCVHYATQRQESHGLCALRHPGNSFRDRRVMGCVRYATQRQESHGLCALHHPGNSFRDRRVMGCVLYATQDQQTFLTVLNIHNHSCNLENLNKHLLKALFQCQLVQQSYCLVMKAVIEAHWIASNCTGCQRPQANNWHIRMQKDLLLTLDWNSPEVAMTDVFLKDPSSKFKIDKAVFEQALTRPDRQLFVAIFLEQGFQAHKYLTSYRLKQLFKKSFAKEFFYSVCWEGLLGYRKMSTVSKYFVDVDLNYLIYKLSGIPNFVSAQELNQNAMSMYETSDASAAERKAITLLAMWATFSNKNQLAQLLCCQSDQPIHLALILSYIYTRLQPYVSETNVATEMEDHSKEFAKMAIDMLDCSYKDQTCRTYYVLCEENPDWLGKTAVDIAALSKNKTFLAHPCCQRWLTNVFMGNVSIREVPWGVFPVPVSIKVILSAFFVFPMYMWVRFKTDPHIGGQWEEAADNESDEGLETTALQTSRLFTEDSDSYKSCAAPLSGCYKDTPCVYLLDVYPKCLSHVSSSQQSGDRFPHQFLTKMWIDKSQQEQIFVYSPPPLWTMIRMMWGAPITKFWTFQVFYVLYLALFSFAVLWPSCGNQLLDLVVCVWTALLMLESIHRARFIYMVSIQKLTNMTLFLKCLEVALMGVFIYLYLLSRVIFPSALLSPYQSKVMLCLGLLYFYYRIVAISLPISPTLGPLLYKVKLMAMIIMQFDFALTNVPEPRLVLVDFYNFFRMTLIIMLSGGIAIHAVTYPDFPMTKEMLRRIFHQAWFTLFLTPIENLEEDSRCQDKLTIHPDICRGSRCHDNHDDDFTCPNTGFWPYVFTINYLIFIKLILVTLLFALFSHLQECPEGRNGNLMLHMTGTEEKGQAPVLSSQENNSL
ncbi:TRPM [Cordylochernes scorpioides]|uniref:TRPM n=1 Tax=Cordylochernes scorpioides TaxID=51811 RepID=A0ABY6KNR3_9ARAC|nr:TRPM [Cordylochernes scorpioides]